MDKCRWLVPVRPGDTISGRFTILKARRSKSRPMGLVWGRSEMFNQNDEMVLLLEGTGMYGLRPETGGGE